MGLRLSFVILCLLHSFAANEAGGRQTANIFGDDLIAYWNDDQITKYNETMEQLGFVMNRSKEFKSHQRGVFCGTPIENKPYEEYPSIKEVISRKTTGFDTKEQDDLLRCKEVINSNYKKCKGKEKKIFSQWAKNVNMKYISAMKHQGQLHIPEHLGGIGLLPYSKQQTKISSALNQIIPKMSREEQISYYASINSAWKACIFGPEQRLAEHEICIKIEKEFSGETKSSIRTDELIDFTCSKVKNLFQFWVNEGRTKVDYERQDFLSCINRQYGIILNTFKSFHTPNNRTVSTLTIPEARNIEQIRKLNKKSNRKRKAQHKKLDKIESYIRLDKIDECEEIFQEQSLTKRLMEQLQFGTSESKLLQEAITTDLSAYTIKGFKPRSKLKKRVIDLSEANFPRLN